jgi:hypothetical protein
VVRRVGFRRRVWHGWVHHEGATLDDVSTRPWLGPVGWYIITSRADENLSARSSTAANRPGIRQS